MQLENSVACSLIVLAARSYGDPADLPLCLLNAAIRETEALGGCIYRLEGNRAICIAVQDYDSPTVTADLQTIVPQNTNDPYTVGTVVTEGDQDPIAFVSWEGARQAKVVVLLRYAKGTLPDHVVLSSVGGVLSLAIENAWLRDESDRERRQNSILFRVSQAFMSTMKLEPLLDLIVSSGVETLEKAENCVLHLLDGENNRLVATRLSFNASAKQMAPEDSVMRPGVGAAGLALSTGQVVNIGNVTEDERFFPKVNPRGIRSLLTAPLIFRERFIGTLSVDATTLDAFSQEDERLLMTLATQAAAAIYNADLIKDLQQSLIDLQSTQAQLIQSEKLSALGQLIAGITHELNNPLAAISGYAQLLQMTDGVDAQTRQDVTKIYTQAQRAARIVRNLLTFAREHASMRRPTDIHAILQQTLELQVYQLRIENISIDLRLTPKALYVMGDPHQLQQVFFNLISNARDAMTEAHGGGRLTLWTELVNQMVHIHIADTGPGLSEEAQHHLFEPFFTTKEVGKGTGLGLSICFGIVTNHDGSIALAQSNDTGAEFVVTLPYTTQEPDRTEPEPVSQSTLLTNRLVLLVEDEDPVARVVQRVLAQDGHRVLVGRDGREALRYLGQAQERKIPIDLIISDIKMPNMSGSELYDALMEGYPEMGERILFVTGDSVSRSTRTFLVQNGLPFLIKPFGLEELRGEIDRMLAHDQVIS